MRLEMHPIEIREIRQTLGLTQAQLALALRLSPTNGARLVRRWEAGEQEITGPAMVALEYMVEFGVLK
jgi:DNA-binding transcriptional regulator YiaG